MKNKKLKIICAILFIMIIIFPVAIDPVNAAINKSYSEATTKAGTEDINIETKLKSSAITDALGIFVFSVASLVENLVGNAFTAVTRKHRLPLG